MSSGTVSLKFSQINLNDYTDVNKRDHLDRTPLMFAAQRGNTFNVYQLIKHKAVINRADTHGKTALMYAAESGMTGAAKVLLRWRAKVNKTDLQGKTALMYAAKHGFARMCRLLLSYHANPNYISKDKQKTALLYASYYGNTLDVNILKAVSKMSKHPIDPTNMPLLNNILSAVLQRCNRYSCIKMLIKSGANMNSTDSHKTTALMYIACSMQSSIFELLESQGFSCDFNNSIPRTSYEDINSGFKAFQYLIKHGADIYCLDKSGYSLNDYVQQFADSRVLAYFSIILAQNSIPMPISQKGQNTICSTNIHHSKPNQKSILLQLVTAPSYESSNNSHYAQSNHVTSGKDCEITN